MSRSTLSTRSIAVLTAVLLWPSTPGAAGAQDLGTDCRLASYRTTTSQAFGNDRTTWIGGPLLICPDGTRIRADSAVVYEGPSRSELIGSVEFDHPERTLRADYADFYESQDRLFAVGSVAFRDLLRHTEVSGDTLTFLEGGRFRPEDQMQVSGRPATALLVPSSSEVAGPPPEPYRVTAARIRSQGNRFFWAGGETEVERDGLLTVSDSLAFDEQGGNLILTGGARAHRDELTLDGDRITLLIPGDVLEAVELVGRAQLLSSDLQVTGDEIRLALADEEIQHLVAVGRPPPGEAIEAVSRPRLIAEDLFVVGDSIDVNAPGEILETVVAAGTARVETRAPSAATGGAPPPPPLSEDSAAVTEAEELLQSLSADDWMEGDLIVANFVRVPEALPGMDPGDGVAQGPQYRIDELVASGNARSWYRTPPEGAEPPATRRERWAISYLLADAIRVHFAEGEVEWIEALGTVRGYQLEPERTDAPPVEVTTTEDRP